MSNNRMNRINSEIQKHLAGIISKFDDVDIAMMVHASTAYAVTMGAVGCIAKRIVFH